MKICIISYASIKRSMLLIVYFSCSFIYIYIISHIIGYVTIIYFKNFVLQEIGHKSHKLWLLITFFSPHIPLFLIDKIGGTIEGCHLCMSLSHQVQYTNRSFGCIWYIIDMTYCWVRSPTMRLTQTVSVPHVLHHPSTVHYHCLF